MYYVYADGFSIYNQFDRSLTIHSPKVTLELGKAGSFQFDIPPTNQYYNSLTQLKTIIRVELDDKTIFYGRVFSITRNFNNIKHVYCEGALSYLIDTLQQAKSYKGKAKQLFKNIIDAHNALVDSDKKFTVDRLEIEDTDVIIPGKKDKDGKYYGDEYEQTIIESIAEEWLTTYDYINNVLIEYLGGYLIYEYDANGNKISYISEDSFDQMIEDASSKNLNVPTINYGVNMLDLTEELNAEDLCTVLIPIGDDGLTIEKATNKNQYSDVKIENIDGKSIAIAHKSSVERYGKIIKSYVFDNVNEANTLFTNGYKYLKAHKNIPISFTVKAVDMHFVNKDQDSISVGEIAKIDSTPHNLVEYLICTKVEYELEDASKNQYTFGNPKQSLTERYKKNKEKQKQRASRSSTKSSSKALSTASDIAQAYSDSAYEAAVETVNKNYATIKNWVEDHYAGIEEAVHFVSTNGEGFVRSTKWVDEYGANTEEVLTWHGKYAESAVSTIKWANDYSAGIEDAVNWKTRNAEGLASTKKWVDDNGAGIEDAVNWKGKNAEGLLSSKRWVDNYSAGIADTIKWKNDNAAGLINSKKWIDNYSAGIADVIAWKGQNATGLINSKRWIDNYSAGIADTIKWKNDNATGLINSKKWIDNYSAGIADTIAWKSTNGSGLITAKKWIDDNKASIEETVRWKSGADSSISGIKSTADAAKAMASLFAEYGNNKASVKLSADANTALVKIVGNVLVDKLKANSISIGYPAKIILNENGLEVKTKLIVTNTGSDLLVRNIYKSGIGNRTDDTQILNRYEARRDIKTNVFDTNFTTSNVRKAFKGDYKHLYEYFQYVLNNKSLSLNNLDIYGTTKIWKNTMENETLDDRIKRLAKAEIDSAMTTINLRNKIKNNNSITFQAFILSQLVNQTINCDTIKVKINSDQVSLKSYIDTKMSGHYHRIPSQNITIKSINGKLTNDGAVNTSTPV